MTSLLEKAARAAYEADCESGVHGLRAGFFKPWDRLDVAIQRMYVVSVRAMLGVICEPGNAVLGISREMDMHAAEGHRQNFRRVIDAILAEGKPTADIQGHPV